MLERQIRHRTVRNLVRYRGAPPAQIERRLEKLQQEWDVEHALAANAAASALAGLALARLVDRRFMLLSVLAAGFLLQHALLGWSPPFTLLRRLGFRTPAEIEVERRTLLHMLDRESEWPYRDAERRRSFRSSSHDAA